MPKFSCSFLTPKVNVLTSKPTEKLPGLIIAIPTVVFFFLKQSHIIFECMNIVGKNFSLIKIASKAHGNPSV